MKLLFAEDDRDLSTAVRTLLERNGYMVDTVYDGAEAVDYALEGEYDGMILDWMMPVRDGVEALREMRSKGIRTPCILLTARDAVEDRVTGLDAGADDYLPKPFASAELLARIRAMLRRREDYHSDQLAFSDLTLLRGEMLLQRGESSVKLGNKAYQIMEMLMEQPGRVFEVNQIIDRVWGWDSDADMNVVWVTVFQLRKVLKELGTAAVIKATRGVGYSLEEGT